MKLKRALCCCIIVLLLFPLICTFRVSASFSMPEVLDGVENLCLSYTFNPTAADYGRQTEAYFLPYVGYCQSNGAYTDSFMDSYLFLPHVTYGPSGGTMYRSETPAIASDWNAYVIDLFKRGYNVDALNSAVETVGDLLGNPELSVSVFFTCLYPKKGQMDFGSLGGTALNFTNLEDRKKAVRWMVDEQLSLFQSGRYSHLQLRGFYWFEEDLLTWDPEEIELVRYFNDYVHSLGYKTIWIPYYCASGWQYWKQYGFDVACMQPNLMWSSEYLPNRVSDCIEKIEAYGMCMEMEMDWNATSWKQGFYFSYLREGIRSGVSEAIKMYYQGGAPGTLYYACYSSEASARAVYDLTYRYAKGLLTEEEVQPVGFSIQLPEEYRMVSVGKPYTATVAYTGDGSLEYQDVDGTELTNGVLVGDILSTEWHGFHVSRQEADGGFSITLDLGKTMHRLAFFGLIFGRDLSCGIDLPRDIYIWVSEDGNSFRQIGTIKDGTCDYGWEQVTLETEGISARYIRATFSKGDVNFVFCSEFLVGQEKYLAGDLDEDGILSAYDAVLMLQYFAGEVTADCALVDINEDGSVGAEDSVFLLQYLAGMDPAYP